ncbi:low temperature requirement protein A [Micromonospora sp. M12]
MIEVVGLSIGYPWPGGAAAAPSGGWWRWASRREVRGVRPDRSGESILVTGSTFTSHVDLATSGAFLLAFAGSVALWWVYFARSAPAATQVIARAGERTGGLSRVAFNYLHPLIVAGVIVTSAGDERLLREPGSPTTTVAALFTLGGPALFLAGHAAYKALLWRTLPTSRITAVVVLLALVPVCVGWECPSRSAPRWPWW